MIVFQYSELVWNPALYPNTESKFSKHTHLRRDNYDNNGEGSAIVIGIPECLNIQALRNNEDTWLVVHLFK